MQIMNSILISFIIFINCTSMNKEMDSIKSTDTPFGFTGNVSVSTDDGNNWMSLDSDIPNEMRILALKADAQTLFIGSEYGEIKNIDLRTSKLLTTEKVLASLISKTPIKENSVSEIFTLPSGKYAWVLAEGLFRKSDGSDFWQPMNTPEAGHGIIKMVENKDGILFLACEYGVFKSVDRCKTWEKVFAKGFINDMILHQGTLWLKGILGFHHSTDSGKTWTNQGNIMEMLGNHTNDDYNIKMFENDNKIYVFKANNAMDLVNIGARCSLIFSEDQGKTWQHHPIEKQIKNQASIQNIFFHQGNIYYTTKHELMKSEDKGLTWRKVLYIPQISENRSIRLLISGDNLIVSKDYVGC